MNLQKQTNREDDLEQNLEPKCLDRKNTPKKVRFASQQNQRTKTKNSQLSSHQKARHKTKKSKSKTNSSTQIRSSANRNMANKVHDFQILTRCIKVYCEDELKKGRTPWKHVVKLIEAFNKSQLRDLNPEVQELIKEIIKTLNFAHLKIQHYKISGQTRKEKHKSTSTKVNRFQRHNILFDSKSPKLQNFSQSNSSEFSFSGQGSNQKPQNYKHNDLDHQYFESRVIEQIGRLQKALAVLSEEHKKLMQARQFAIKYTKYQRWVQINKLRQILKQQANQISKSKVTLNGYSEENKKTD